jgi:predicted phosphodiesterase
LRTGLFSDLHGNAVAFDALLADLERRPVDQLVCLGDTVQGGPQPRETVERLERLGCPVVMGNADWFVLTGESAEEISDEQRLAADWTRAQLGDDGLAFVRGFAPTVELDGVLAFHATPGSFDDVILPWTPEEEFARLLGEAAAPVLAGGHTHLQFIRRRGASLFVNPGSAGLAYGYDQPRDAIRFDPWAEYAVVSDDGALAIEFRRVPFDSAEVVRAFDAAGEGERARGWR